MYTIQPQALTSLDKLHSLVEHRNKFSLDFCEMNVFETHQKANDFKLSFEGFTITSMLRGKKVMKLEGMDAFDYLPGESVLAPAQSTMFIDFPEAELEKPTQCTALVIDNSYLNQNLQRINESLHKDQTLVSEWKVDLAELILRNNAQMAQLTSKLLFAFNQKEPLLDFQVDILLRELILSMLREQNLTVLRREKGYSKDNPFEEVFRFIRQHLQDKILIDDLCKVACMSKSTFYRTFVETYAISPVQLINEERIKFAKELLIQPEVSVKEAGYAAGFNDPNYFCRLFKKIEGMAPGSYRKIHGFT